jgi:hypothetical protein
MKAPMGWFSSTSVGATEGEEGLLEVGQLAWGVCAHGR